MNAIGLTSIITSSTFIEQLGSEEDSHNVSHIAVWLLETAVLTPTSQLSFAALQAIQVITASHSTCRIEVALAMSSHYSVVLSKLGAKDEKVKHDCDESKSKELVKSKAHIRRGERLRAVERLLEAMRSIVE